MKEVRVRKESEKVENASGTRKEVSFFVTEEGKPSISEFQSWTQSATSLHLDKTPPLQQTLSNGISADDTSGYNVHYVYDSSKHNHTLHDEQNKHVITGLSVEETPRLEPELTAAEKELPWKRQNATPPMFKRDFLGNAEDSRRASVISTAGDIGSEYIRRLSSAAIASQPHGGTVAVVIDEVEESSVEDEVSSL